jgi:hypothetical protein
MTDPKQPGPTTEDVTTWAQTSGSESVDVLVGSTSTEIAAAKAKLSKKQKKKLKQKEKKAQVQSPAPPPVMPPPPVMREKKRQVIAEAVVVSGGVITTPSGSSPGSRRTARPERVDDSGNARYYCSRHSSHGWSKVPAGGIPQEYSAALTRAAGIMHHR